MVSFCGSSGRDGEGGGDEQGRDERGGARQRVL